MNASTTTDRAAEIERYLAGVSAAFADLPAQVRLELLEDLPDHLAEIAADDPAPLDSRLGPPPAYAAELRAAVGLDATKPRHRADRWAEAAAKLRPHARTLDERVGAVVGYDRLVDLLADLRPAWWILRGYVTGIVLLHLFADAYDVYPHDSDAGMLGWPLVLGLVGVSIRIGRRPVRLVRRFGPRWVAAGAVAVVFAAWSLTLLDIGHDDYQPAPSGPVGDAGAGYRETAEVYVYTESGRSITNVRVFTRGGVAVPVGVPMGCGPSNDDWAWERRGCIPQEAQRWAPESGPAESVEPSGSPSPSAS